MAHTSLTVWVIEIGMRVTFDRDGIARTLRGFEPDFNPLTVTYLTDRAVGNIAAQKNMRINGDQTSPSLLAKYAETVGWLRPMTIEDVLDHAYLGKTAPSLETITAAYAEDEAVAA